MTLRRTADVAASFTTARRTSLQAAMCLIKYMNMLEDLSHLNSSSNSFVAKNDRVVYELNIY
jgi:hypothetical protein